MWAIITILVLQVLDLGYALAKHGEPKTGRYNFFVTLITASIEMWLFYEAGLFDKLLH